MQVRHRSEVFTESKSHTSVLRAFSVPASWVSVICSALTFSGAQFLVPKFPWLATSQVPTKAQELNVHATAVRKHINKYSHKCQLFLLLPLHLSFLPTSNPNTAPLLELRRLQTWWEEREVKMGGRYKNWKQEQEGFNLKGCVCVWVFPVFSIVI